MAIKDILVLLDAWSEAAGSYALSVTSACEAHLTGAVLVVDPTTIMAFAEAPPGFLAAGLNEGGLRLARSWRSSQAEPKKLGLQSAPKSQKLRPALSGKLWRVRRHFNLTIIESPIRMSTPIGRVRLRRRCSPRAGLCWLFPTFKRPRSNWSRFWWPGTEALRRRVHSGMHCPCWRRPRTFRL